VPPSALSDAPALQIDRLSFAYPGQGPVIDFDASRAGAPLRLARGEQLLLVGGSGTGKSTLLHLVSGLMDPSAGEVLVAGQAIHALHGAARDHFRGRHIGMVFQTFNLLHGFTALENVMAPMMFSAIPKGEHSARARSLLEHLGIREVDKDVDRLSVGQQQRVAVARAVACDPVLVLADEPTASLDPENAAGAISLIQSLCREKNAALLCVSHDPSLPSQFPRQLHFRALAPIASPATPTR
jgi:putative ABC transport system ATP-binding protein